MSPVNCYEVGRDGKYIVNTTYVDDVADAICRIFDVIRSLTHGIPPAVYDLTAKLPSLKDLQISVDRLRELCIPCELMCDIADFCCL